MNDDTIVAFSFPAVSRKNVIAAFDSGRLTSDGCVMLLSLAERRLGIADRRARYIPDRRDRMRIAHGFVDMSRVRIFAICCASTWPSNWPAGGCPIQSRISPRSRRCPGSKIRQSGVT